MFHRKAKRSSVFAAFVLALCASASSVTAQRSRRPTRVLVLYQQLAETPPMVEFTKQLRLTISKELGSRHRAAIGLTEENDSVAIVVSEETGALSIVVDGQIERRLDTDALRVRLRSLVLHRGPARTRETRVQYS